MQFPKPHGFIRLKRFFPLYPLKGSRWSRILGVSALLSLLAVPCWAGGLYITEWGTPSTGVANAGAAAVGQDASTAWKNPASMTLLSGTQIMGAGGLLIPNVKFDPDSDTPVSGGDGGQAGDPAGVMGTYFVHSVTDTLKFGFALGSLAGAGLDYTLAPDDRLCI